MLKAELHNKIGIGGVSASAQSEDVLTSTFFGLLSYLPAHFLVAAFQGIKWFGKPSEEDGDLCPPWSGIPEYRFWHRFPDRSEIDLLIKIGERLVAVEVKYLSEMSNKGEEDNQLVRYWEALKMSVSNPSKASVDLIYVTKDACPPQHEIDHTLNLGATSEIRFGWISWLRIHQNLEETLSSIALTGIEELLLRDVIAFLEHRGLSSFAGFPAIPQPCDLDLGSWFPSFISDEINWPTCAKVFTPFRWHFEGDSN